MLTTTVATALTITICLGYLRSALKKEKRSRAVMESARSAGLTEPPSLHPVIDAARCIGCGSCVAACPEKQVLGLVEGDRPPGFVPTPNVEPEPFRST